ncbi:hypothetical protein PAPYR_2748 [Paratrimastix pyriformis]|uniref:Uncharacterized protein n=1 Tax=Paratrimastix pyriformis TaxID=342808 RepID=A0ABQ8US46_9EUKA|nr:hypothetical protein PAPYR_2748 [Paratrimastix pyriformis]
MFSPDISRSLPPERVFPRLLPDDLLVCIVDASPEPLRTYLELMGASHAIRTAIRGSPRELSFINVPAIDDEDEDPAPTAEELATIVSPCKSLSKLTFPRRWRFPPRNQAWLEEAFAARLCHLTSLSIPEPELLQPAAMELVLTHQPKLVELHLPLITSSLFGALGRSCPNLQALHVRAIVGDLSQAVPLAGRLRQLVAPDFTIPKQGADPFAQGLTVLERLDLRGCPSGFLRPVASHLAHLALPCYPVAGLDEMGFCQLETLEVAVARQLGTGMARLLARNQSTLRSVTLWLEEEPDLGPLPDALGRLTRLASLDLRQKDAMYQPLPPELLDRLSQLAIWAWCTSPVDIAGPRLRTLRLNLLGLSTTDSVAVRCPALEDLALAAVSEGEPKLVLDCPRLRALGLVGLLPQRILPMPLLARVHGSETHQFDTMQEKLRAWFPQLRQTLDAVVVPAWVVKTLLRASSPLQCVRDLLLDAADLSNPFAVTLPGQLEHLEATLITRGKKPLDLRVDAPGLRIIRMGIQAGGYEDNPEARLTLQCPSLACLAISSIAGPTAVEMASSAEGTSPPLRSLRVGAACTALAASLFSIMARHGARLCRLVLPELITPASWRTAEAALSQLPRLATLTMCPAPDMRLACPQLRLLSLTTSQNPLPLRSLVLDCPLLEEVRGWFLSGFGRVELARPAPFLRRLGKVYRKGAVRAEQFPGVEFEENALV